MRVQIIDIPAKNLVGKKIITSLAKDETSKLWRPLRQIINESPQLSPKKFYSINRYGKEFKEGDFTIDTFFEKCAAIEGEIKKSPLGLEEIKLEGGLYAVFEHSGPISKFQKSLEDFMINWLPNSGYELDSKAHFETFDESYDPFSESSVELIYIPVKPIKNL
jgi:AraC family transcriptional regulator